MTAPSWLKYLLPVLLLGGSHWYAYRAGSDAANLRHQLVSVTAARDTAVADLAAYQAETNRLHGLAVQLDQRIETLAAAQPKIIERWKRETKINPVPADCRPGAERLRIINDAIAAANAAHPASPEQALPADSAGDRK